MTRRALVLFSVLVPYCVDAYGEHDNDVYDDDDRSSTITITIIRYITLRFGQIQTLYLYYA